MPERPTPRPENKFAVLTNLHDVIHTIELDTPEADALGDFTVFAIASETTPAQELLQATEKDYVLIAENMAYGGILLDMHQRVLEEPAYQVPSAKLADNYQRLIDIYKRNGMSDLEADRQAAHDIKNMTLTHLEGFLPPSLRQLPREERIARLSEQIARAVHHPFDPVPQEGSVDAIADYLEEKLRETMFLRRLPTFTQPETTPEFTSLVEAKMRRLQHTYTEPGYYETLEAIDTVYEAQTAVFAMENRNPLEASYLAYMEMQAALLPLDDDSSK